MIFGRSAYAPALVDGYDTLLFDLDGVVYAGPNAIPGAIETIERLSEHAQIGYLTNNASRTTEQVAAHLRELGLSVTAKQVVSSPQSALRLLQARVPAGASVLVIGGDGIRSVLIEAGYTIVDSADNQPAAVVQGFSPTLGWADLAEAAFALRGSEVLWIATNMDWTIPVARGIAPGNGTLVSAVHTAAGRMPDVVAGKPERPIFDLALERFGAQRALMIGDRLDTDILGAKRAGIASVHVLTGIDRPKQLLAARPEERPDYILATLQGLLASYPAVERKRSGWSVGDALVHVDGTDVRIARAGSDRLNLLRAGCAAIWNAEQSIHALRVPEVLYAEQ